MITWKMRHEGSPQHIEGLIAEDIVEGVLEGQWEPTDEVMGPQDSTWQALEIHPHFAQAMSDYEPPTAPPHPDEARLDMNPLIDVSLVLLIFFILTTTYESLRKTFPAPGSTKEQVKSVNDSKLKEFTIRVAIKVQAGQEAFFVENEPIPVEQLQTKLEEWVKKTGNSVLAIEVADKSVPWKAFVAVQSAAAGAKIQEIIRVERPTPQE